MSDASQYAQRLVPPTELMPAPVGEPPVPLEPAAETAAPGGGLGRAATMGFVLMAGQSVVTRVLSFAAQIGLARLLTPEQFGLFNLSMAIVSYANLAQQVGVREILVSRQKRLELWSNAGFWVATTTSVLSMLLILGIAPLAAWFYGDSALFGMLVVLALAQPTYNLTVVQEAKLQAHLRFRYMALGQFLQGALLPLLQLVLALLHFQVYAFVLPRLVVGLVRCWFYGRAEKATVKRTPQFRAWKYILVPGSLVLLTNLAYTIGPSVPTLMLGRFVGKDEAGFFGFAYALSLQAFLLLSTQIDAVLFPTLGKMKGDPARQRAALLRAASALTAVLAPICMFQIAAGRPLVMLVFGARWEPSVIVLQILCVGMVVCGGFMPAQSLLQAQMRFKAKLFIALLWGVVSAVVSAAGIVLAPKEYALPAAAVGLAIGQVGGGFHVCVAATRPLGGGVSDALRVIALPSVLGILSGILAWGCGTLVPEFASRLWLTQLLEIAVIGVVGSGSYAILLRTFARPLWLDLLRAGDPIVRRLRGALPARFTRTAR